MNNIKRIRHKGWFFGQVIILALAVGSSVALGAVMHNTPDACFTKSCSMKATEIQSEKNMALATIISSTNQAPIQTDVKVTAPVTVAPVVMSPEQVRQFIVTAYNKYISDTKVYLIETYPEVEERYSAAANVGTQPSMLLGPPVYNDIVTRTSDFKQSFCDLNTKITTQDDIDYCHSAFDIMNVRTSLYISPLE